MLVLARELDQSIMIGDDIEITVKEITANVSARLQILSSGRAIELPITAPAEIIVTEDHNKRELTLPLENSIWIGKEIQILIDNIRNGKVRLAINAPRDTSVHRKEIWLAIQKEKEEQPPSTL